MNRTRISHFYCVLFPDLAPDDALFLEKTFQKQIQKMYLKGSVSVCMWVKGLERQKESGYGNLPNATSYIEYVNFSQFCFWKIGLNLGLFGVKVETSLKIAMLVQKTFFFFQCCCFFETRNWILFPISNDKKSCLETYYLISTYKHLGIWHSFFSKTFLGNIKCIVLQT